MKFVTKEQSQDNASSSIDGDSVISELENGSRSTLTNTNDGSSKPKDDDLKLQLAKKETDAVFKLRVVVFVVLFLASITVSLVVYTITVQGRNSVYEAQYNAAAKKITQAFMDIADSKLGALASLGVAVIAHGVDHARHWPFVTLSSFQQRASIARSQSGSLHIELCPWVESKKRTDWEKFAKDNQQWIVEGLRYQKDINLFHQDAISSPLQENIWYYNQGGEQIIDPGPGPYLPVWQTSPIFNISHTVNENIMRLNLTGKPSQALENAEIIISEFITAPPGDIQAKNRDTSFFALLLSTEKNGAVEYKGDPMSLVSVPVYNSFIDNRTTVGVIVAWIHWASYFESILPETVSGIVVILSNTCGGRYTFEIIGSQVSFLGEGDLHNPDFSHKNITSTFSQGQVINDGTTHGITLDQDPCNVQIDIYPSHRFYDSYADTSPTVITLSVSFIFVFTAVLFLLYDRLVERRQALVLQKALQSSAIVSSLFPKNFRDRLMTTNKGDHRTRTFKATPASRLKGYLGSTDTRSLSGDDGDEPMAELFPDCTVFFADIAGFTAWSSTRDPGQVFVLLQALYQAFDVIANKRKVFKVETIGDSYVAVTGLPDAQPKHALIMARFATECMAKMKELVLELETVLGPDTADLSVRMGLHSGPVTAGVLKGDRARFQLFGDTVNTAARMESTGIKNKIQVSQQTHDQLVNAGKAHWMCPREDVVNAKGKGILKTYWLNTISKPSSNVSGSSMVDEVPDSNPVSAPATIQNSSDNIKQDRLIDWMVDLLREQLEKVIARNDVEKSQYKPSFKQADGRISLDEVTDVIRLRQSIAQRGLQSSNSRQIDTNKDITLQLRQYVAIIASTYRNNPFHNFEHACHVTMAVSKFIKRIVATTCDGNVKAQGSEALAKLYDYTYCIHSDPLTVLAILFSALVHDADHRGVSNLQLSVEEPEMATIYKNKSIAEQNSLDIAWKLLMSDQFEALQTALFSSEDELKRFRQVMVNVVLATDIFDKEINEMRKKRWSKAFADESSSDPSLDDLRTTIVIEHIIQASDVAHTMQHWHVYRKWNQRLFYEMYAAYKAGRMGRDPSEFWYEGELGFFDNYVIPLAKKLKDCNVFGVSSDECLNYAVMNRAEWETRGREIVTEMVNELCQTELPMKLDED